jgi:putative peptidoglycan lipid II flippase
VSEGDSSIVRGAGVISALTMLSRILGLVRDCASAALFGAGPVWDAFSFAFRIPNLFRRLFGEGALSAAFIPVFSETLELGRKEEAERLAGRVLGLLAALLIALLVVGEAVVLVTFWCTGTGRWHLALLLTAVMLPYMLMICLTAVAGAVLNSLRHFAAPAAAPVILNICWIAAVLLIAPGVSDDGHTQIMVVAAAIVAAGVLQLALQCGALLRLGFQPRLALRPRDGDVRRIARGMLPVVLGMAAFQLNVLLDGVIAIALAGPEAGATFGLGGTRIGYPMLVGANSVLYYAGRLMQLPLGVFGIAIATAVFPALSRHAARRDWEAFSAALRSGLGFVVFLGLPASVGLVLVCRPLVELIFERGAFTAEMSARTANALAAYATGVWAYCALHVVARAFYSVQKPGTPAKVAASCVVLNLALNLSLVWYLGETGLACATAICAAVQTAVLMVLLSRCVPLHGMQALTRRLLPAIVATICMGIACRGVLASWYLPPDGGATWLRAARLLAAVGAGGVAYAVGAAALGLPEVGQVLRLVLRSSSRP